MSNSARPATRRRVRTDHIPQPPAPERLALTIQEGAFLINSSVTTTRKLMENGTIPTIRLGKRRLIPRQAIAEFLGVPA